VSGGGGPLVARGTDRALVAESRAVLARNARSFRWGALLLPAAARDDAAVVYAFCRLADDLADERGEASPEARRAGATADLARLDEELVGRRPARPLVGAFLGVCARRRIDPACAAHLLEGMRSDLGPVALADRGALVRYCYQVAGTVGLMMCGVLGVEDEAALPHAIDLGIGMQLTNICRDVAEDAHRDRVYLPADGIGGLGAAALREAGPAAREAVRREVWSLLELADRYYASGWAGLPAIPRRTRPAIAVAGALYRGIGHRLRRLGADPLDGRTVVGPAEKLRLAVGALLTLPLAHRARHDARLHESLAGLPGAHPPAV
jgi:15-cis-phytoene synthase